MLLLLAACRPDPDPVENDDSVGVEDSGGETSDDPPDEDDTGTGVPPTHCVTEQDVSPGVLMDGWIGADGTLYALSAPSVRVRAPDGTWTLDPPNPAFWYASAIDGHDDVPWIATSRDGVFRREPDGTWLDMGVPPDMEAQALRVRADDDVTVLTVQDLTCADCNTRNDPDLLHWDGVAWSLDDLPIVNGAVFGAGFLSDGTVLLATSLGIRATDGTPVPVVSAEPFRRIEVGPDDTIVALGGQEVAIGTVDGLVVVDLAFPDVYEWTSAAIRSADDIWLSGQSWLNGLSPLVTVVHWDGASWTEVPVDETVGTLNLVAGDEVFALGAYDHEVALVGDTGGLVLEREIFLPGSLYRIAMDDVTGTPWASSWGRVLGTYEDGAWRGVPLPPAFYRAEGIAASGGRVAVWGDEVVYVLVDGLLSDDPATGVRGVTGAGVDGVLFVAARPVDDEEENDPGTVILREAGNGWETLDTTGLPVGADVYNLWADGPDDLWISASGDRTVALMHWDGASWTRATDLADDPQWMGRLADGLLYLSLYEGEGARLYTWDGAALSEVPDLPAMDIRSAHVLADGTWFLNGYGVEPTGDRDKYGRLVMRVPGGDWEEVVTADYGIAMGGSADTVWAGHDESAWTRAPCAP